MFNRLTRPIRQMGWVIAGVTALLFSGCASMSAMSGVSSAAMDGVLYVFQGEEVSVPLGTDATLASCQRGLQRIGFHINVLEKREEGYALYFGDEHLNGKMEINYETDRLNTVFVQVRNGIIRSTSVEKAVLDAVEATARKISTTSRFSYKGYIHVYNDPDSKGKPIAWYRIGSPVPYQKAIADARWLQITLPSRRYGFIQSKQAGIRDA